MKPTANRVLILVPPEPKDQKAGDLYLPEIKALNQYPHAKVIAVGPKCVDIKAGDTVMIDRYAMTGTRVTLNDKLHFIIAEPDVIAIIT